MNTYHWYTIDEARAEWGAAPMNDAQLQQLLDVAQVECETFAPALDPTDTVTIQVPDPDGDPGDTMPKVVQAVPVGYRVAHLMHARNIFNAEKANPSGGFGTDEGSFSMTIHPLDWTVQQRLRPKRIFGGVVR